MPAVRDRMRQVRNRWIDQTLLRLEQARRQLEQGEGDILLLGDSSCLYWAHADTDRTLIPELLAERTGASIVTVAGGGYDARMHDALLRVLGMADNRPRAVLACLAIRPNTATHVREHPLHGHGRTRAALARISPPLRRVRAFANGGSAAPKREVAEFRARTVTTRWGGTATLGERLAKVEGLGPPPWPTEVEQMRFDYFHGQPVHDDNPGLADLTAFGRRLDEYGVPAVVCWSQVPVAHGERLFPGEFETAIEHDLGLVEQALCQGSTRLDGLLKPVLEDTDFQDYRNGIEHYSYSGRVKVADEMAKALAALGV
ncbi:hypothetical protein SFC88_04195 [Nocardioides sp. HM23]|uniref:hypothetical protein n=1 Tax=Nocardioides bizhenqiangii TaxID=3095076 RepID=UPI002ACACAC2|nr:hypothetical protein [Nocardioides sp. HM23]MDZ5620008.1 hypothetical protein [Nocardioides sp. HM23]